jgi:hypothetical protein
MLPLRDNVPIRIAPIWFLAGWIAFQVWRHPVR